MLIKSLNLKIRFLNNWQAGLFLGVVQHSWDCANGAAGDAALSEEGGSVPPLPTLLESPLEASKGTIVCFVLRVATPPVIMN